MSARCRAGKVLYWVQITSTESAKLRTYQQGSKLYSSKVMARSVALGKRLQGFKVEIFQTETNWELIAESQ